MCLNKKKKPSLSTSYSARTFWTVRAPSFMFMFWCCIMTLAGHTQSQWPLADCFGAKAQQPESKCIRRSSSGTCPVNLPLIIISQYPLISSVAVFFAQQRDFSVFFYPPRLPIKYTKNVVLRLKHEVSSCSMTPSKKVEPSSTIGVGQVCSESSCLMYCLQLDHSGGGVGCRGDAGGDLKSQEFNNVDLIIISY